MTKSTENCVFRNMFTFFLKWIQDWQKTNYQNILVSKEKSVLLRKKIFSFIWNHLPFIRMLIDNFSHIPVHWEFSIWKSCTFIPLNHNQCHWTHYYTILLQWSALLSLSDSFYSKCDNFCHCKLDCKSMFIGLERRTHTKCFNAYLNIVAFSLYLSPTLTLSLDLSFSFINLRWNCVLS